MRLQSPPAAAAAVVGAAGRAREAARRRPPPPTELAGGLVRVRAVSRRRRSFCAQFVAAAAGAALCVCDGCGARARKRPGRQPTEQVRQLNTTIAGANLQIERRKFVSERRRRLPRLLHCRGGGLRLSLSTRRQPHRLRRVLICVRECVSVCVYFCSRVQVTPHFSFFAHTDKLDKFKQTGHLYRQNVKKQNAHKRQVSCRL